MTAMNEQSEAIAIIGMAGRFPGAKTLEAFWDNLRNGREAVRFFSDDELLAGGVSPELLDDPDYVKASIPLEEMDQFDAGFFDYTAEQAEIIDPQHRLFLEACWQAMENAGYPPGSGEEVVGVIGGAGTGNYLLYNLLSNLPLLQKAGVAQVRHANRADNLATRVAYKLDLRGPALTVQTGCSTSLTAVHLACQSLLGHESDMMLAGGATVHTVAHGYRYVAGGIHSRDGRCRPFDAGASGTVFGSGVGVVLLKRLQDALADGDSIRAVIRGSAINNDGAAKVAYAVPGEDGQTAAIAEALALAQVAPADIGYVETHGTGTPLGDAVEIAALSRAFECHGETASCCAIGSVKSNIGHLDAASGIAGLIKAVLALEQREIPPSLHYHTPNRWIDLSGTPFFVNTELRPWQQAAGPRLAGVSSFGGGGTNVHLVLQEKPQVPMVEAPRGWQLLLLSAKTADALDRATANLAAHLENHPQINLAHVAYTLQVGRQPMRHRRAVLCRDRDEALALLADTGSVQVITGQAESQQAKRVPKSLLSEASEETSLAKLAGSWVAGTEVPWRELPRGQRRRLPLPTYPFERQRHWVEPSPEFLRTLMAAAYPVDSTPELEPREA